MVVAGLVLTGVAAVIHVYIFYLESLAWTGRTARAVFGIRDDRQAEDTRQLAFNQGVYNLLLAIWVLLGTVLIAFGATTVGMTMVYVGAGSMVIAGLVLLATDRRKASAALKQLAAPLLGLIALSLGLLF